MAEPAAPAATPSRRLAVVGAGTMGAQIAHHAALHGWEVELQTRDLDRGRAALRAVESVLERRVAKGRLDRDEYQTARGRMHLSSDPHALSGVDVIIESVIEERDCKRRVLATIGRHADAGALIGTNSSTLPASLFVDCVPQPSRLLNIHFFNPALTMPLVEVVKGEHSSEASVTRAVEFVRGIGKLPVRVERESFGFLANRMLFIAMREAFTLVEQGYVSMAGCDDAVRAALGWPMGPFELADLIGLDVTAAILAEGAAQTGESRWTPPRILQERVDRGDLGRKTGRGFYATG